MNTPELIQTAYNKNNCQAGIVHIGVGAFHRAHQAVFIDHLLALEQHKHWGIIGVNLRAQDADLLQQLKAQNHQYILKTVSPSGAISYQKIAAILDSCDGYSENERAIQIAAQATIALITLTVTEGGYYLFDNGTLDLNAQPVREGIENNSGECIYTYLRGVLTARKNSHGQGMTILSCDNLRDNGSRLKQGFQQFLSACKDNALLDWIEDHIAFPNAMVDRITPKPKQEDALEVRQRLGENDQLTVMSEDFIQWVIEDHFIAPFPPLDQVGVSIVKDIQPYEEAKIRILNGAHTIIAYFGALKGYSTYDKALADPELDTLFSDYQLSEVLPSIDHFPIDLPNYIHTVKARFSNQYIADSIARICGDGANKFSTFILPTLRSCYQRGHSPHHCLRGIAAWYIFMRHYQRGAISFDYYEPKWEALQPLLSPGAEKPFAKSEWIWGDLAQTYPGFMDDLTRAIDSIARDYPMDGESSKANNDNR